MKTFSAHFAHHKLLIKLLPAFFFICSYFALQAQPVLVFNPFIHNLTRPVQVTNANDGSGRLFIVEQDGLVRIWKNGHVLAKPFLNLSHNVPQGKEFGGLYSIAFTPDYKQSGIFFAFYRPFHRK